MGDICFKKYIRAFFRQNLIYKTTNICLEKNKSIENNDISDNNSDLDIFLQDQHIGNGSKWFKFINDKLDFKKIKQENIEDFLL